MSDPKAYHVHLRRIDDDTVSVTADDSTGRRINGVIARRHDPRWWSAFPAYVRRELDDWWKGKADEQEVQT